MHTLITSDPLLPFAHTAILIFICFFLSSVLTSFFFFFLIIRPPPTSTLFPYTTLSRSHSRCQEMPHFGGPVDRRLRIGKGMTRRRLVRDRRLQARPSLAGERACRRRSRTSRRRVMP